MERILYLSQSDIKQLGGAFSPLYVEAVSQALILHAQQDVVQPLKPYLRWRGDAGHIADRIIAMPAYIGGRDPVAGLKWIGSKHDNPTSRGLERASALITLNDPESHYPIAVMEGSLVSGMRTAAVSAIATRHLAKSDFSHVACVGCGVIGRMQLSTLLEQFPSITTIHLFDLNSLAAKRLAERLQQQFPKTEFKIAANAEAAVGKGEVVIFCTVTDKPYVPYSWLQPGTFVSNVSIMDLHKEVFLKADKVVVDDWEQSNRQKKIINQLVLEGSFSREQLHAELGEILTQRRPGRESSDEIIVLNPMGIAIEDIACAQAIYQKAIAAGIGTWLPLY
ncbi:2,3-diaminopropionate biosynthesis protein SbnB [Leptolyngbya cf. ectocarpi LEGE 11479]|uniref:2,3-diaminopropionate biosynthesis protein SbnB n=1 Tax=Leptolyngbya cf. ectocarpi LEGE 11479 TaxID=1828722 RepID=A0A928ZPU2_LEPEC|nr:2,3-diaminopropionate biosynthesis protein SbnB [Leptolyngbya ectocarpi]MBE9065560.1 2,3-diaminopropionate biosynthesis protein SbnB [Leptolyngbya cf. ectocarpi LEGE 11479]